MVMQSLYWGGDMRTYDDLTPTQRAALDRAERALRARVAQMGEVPSGLFDYYARRLEQGPLLLDRDLAAIELLRPYRQHRVWDTGAGVGQVAAALAADGFEVVALDHDPQRLGAIEAVANEVAHTIPGVRLRVMPGAFPAAITDDVSDDIALVMGFTTTMAPELRDNLVPALRRFRLAAIEFGLFVTRTDDPAVERNRLDDYLAGGGTLIGTAEFRHHATGRFTGLYLVSNDA